MEYNHLQGFEIPVLRNRLVLLHHFSDLFCPCIPMFDLEQGAGDQDVAKGVCGPDSLRGVLVSSAKVSILLTYSLDMNHCSHIDDLVLYLSIYEVISF